MFGRLLMLSGKPNVWSIYRRKFRWSWSDRPFLFMILIPGIYLLQKPKENNLPARGRGCHGVEVGTALLNKTLSKDEHCVMILSMAGGLSSQTVMNESKSNGVNHKCNALYSSQVNSKIIQSTTWVNLERKKKTDWRHVNSLINQNLMSCVALRSVRSK